MLRGSEGGFPADVLALVLLLGDTGAISIGEIADHFGFSQPAASSLVSRAEKSGRVRRVGRNTDVEIRTKDPADPDKYVPIGRTYSRTMVYLTPKALQEQKRTRKFLREKHTPDSFSILDNKDPNGST